MTRELNIKCVNVDETETENLALSLTRDCFHRSLRSIKRSVERVEEALDGAEEKEIQALERNISQHNKTLGELIKLEGGLGGEQSKSKSVEIDLDGARHEILERISRIRAATGD